MACFCAGPPRLARATLAARDRRDTRMTANRTSAKLHRSTRVRAFRPSEQLAAVLDDAKRHAHGVAAALCVGVALNLAPLPTQAADSTAVGSCLLQKCQVQLAGCLADTNCLRNLVCLQGCNGRPDEQACQIKCGDQFEDKAVTTFNCCAISDTGCVPQTVTEDLYPEPSVDVLDDSFDVADFQGRWYITAGYNKLFDVFDCQEHYFMSPEPGKMFGNIQWRIGRSNGDFLERSTVQRFFQDPQHPSKLYNHDNEYLHYEDDWYVVAWRPEKYAFIYYKGNNDAWRGYGGATVYTRDASLPEEYIPEFEQAAQAVGLRWADFTVTDNTCKARPLRPSFASLFSGVQRLEERLVREFEDDLQSFGKGFTVIESALENELTAEQRVVRKELADARIALEAMEKSYENKLRSVIPFF